MAFGGLDNGLKYQLTRYVQRHQERQDYHFARKAGYPIGSDGIESANKFICYVRLKRSGAWWYVTNANQMLALRCAKYNGTFDLDFGHCSQNESAGIIAADEGLIGGESRAQEFRRICLPTRPRPITAQHWPSQT